MASGLIILTAMDETLAQRAYLVLQHRLTKAVSSYSDAELDAMAFDPDEVTTLVGLAPTTSHRRGEPDPTYGWGRRFSGWEYSTPVMDTAVTEFVVVALLDRIDPCADGIAAACRAFDLQAGIRVVNDGPDGAGSALVFYSATTIQRLARLGVWIEHAQ